MLDVIKESLWKQFGASIDMLRNAIVLWPESLWQTDKRFFYTVYHTLFFLEYYLSFPPDGFRPLLPATIAKNKADAPADALDDIIPNEIYSKEQLLDYLQSCRSKCHMLITELTEQGLNDRWVEEPGNQKSRNCSKVELLLYNMRHVQHHTAQLNMLLRQRINDAPRWVSGARDNL